MAMKKCIVDPWQNKTIVKRKYKVDLHLNVHQENNWNYEEYKIGSLSTNEI